jgi:hypothetical protein
MLTRCLRCRLQASFWSPDDILSHNPHRLWRLPPWLLCFKTKLLSSKPLFSLSLLFYLRPFVPAATTPSQINNCKETRLSLTAHDRLCRLVPQQQCMRSPPGPLFLWLPIHYMNRITDNNNRVHHQQMQKIQLQFAVCTLGELTLVHRGRGRCENPLTTKLKQRWNAKIQEGDRQSTDKDHVALGRGV